ncbi:MAG: hypothetical protein ABSD53_10265 [Terriglobales bacterium]
MPSMIEMIRKSQVPSNLMQSASRGALSVPPGEMIEILVHLAIHNKLFSERARLTLAGWDEKASVAAAGDPQTSAEVLGYFVSLENLRMCVLPALAENKSVNEEQLDKIVVSGSRAVVEILLTSERVMSSQRLLQGMQSNANLRPPEVAEIAKRLSALETPKDANGSEPPDEVVEVAIVKFLEENAAELEAEKDKAFVPIAATHDEAAAIGIEPAALTDAEKGAQAKVTADAAEQAAFEKKRPVVGGLSDRRDSALQKIAKLNITGRIALAMRGNKEERSILIRDSTKLVSLAVLDSPKVSDGEVEKFALQKNVLEAVLRAIPMRRKYAKNYSIMRNLVFNPRTPLDLGLGLMKNLLIHDLKNLSGNKEVSDTVRKLALRMFKQKLEKKD